MLGHATVYRGLWSSIQHSVCSGCLNSADTPPNPPVKPQPRSWNQYTVMRNVSQKKLAFFKQKTPLIQHIVHWQNSRRRCLKGHISSVIYSGPEAWPITAPAARFLFQQYTTGGPCPQIKHNSAFMFAKSKSKQMFLRTWDKAIFDLLLALWHFISYFSYHLKNKHLSSSGINSVDSSAHSFVALPLFLDFKYL